MALTHQVPRDCRGARRSACPAGAATRGARLRQVNRWHLHCSPSRAPGWEAARPPRLPAGPRVPRAGAGCRSLHLPSVPAGGRGCGGARLLIVLMSTVQLSGPAGLSASHRQRGAESAPAPFSPAVMNWGRGAGGGGCRLWDGRGGSEASS